MQCVTTAPLQPLPTVVLTADKTGAIGFNANCFLPWEAFLLQQPMELDCHHETQLLVSLSTVQGLGPEEPPSTGFYHLRTYSFHWPPARGQVKKEHT